MIEQMIEIIFVGYCKNVWGYLVLEVMICDIDLECDGLVCELIVVVKVQQVVLCKLKECVFGDVNVFILLLVDKYDVKIGGVKGNVMLYLFDGVLKVVIQCVENMLFDECLQVVKIFIDECINEWVCGSDLKIQVLVQQVFEMDKEGKINVGCVFVLCCLEIMDDKW